MSRRSPLLALRTLLVIKQSFGAATGAGPSGGYTRYSRHRAAARWVHHSDDCLSAARTRSTDPMRTSRLPNSSPRKRTRAHQRVRPLLSKDAVLETASEGRAHWRNIQTSWLDVCAIALRIRPFYSTSKCALEIHGPSGSNLFSRFARTDLSFPLGTAGRY